MKIIIANWKLNKTKDEGKQFINELIDIKTNNEIVICPSYLYLDDLTNQSNNKLSIASQNVSGFDRGNYTGEVSAKMLRDIGVKYSLVGHSERKNIFKESSIEINNKINRCIENKIIPIVCIGESYDDFKLKNTKNIIFMQIRNLLKGLDAEKIKKIIIAYEPVWAISENIEVNAALVLDIVSYIKNIIKELYMVENIKVVYGGSVNSANSNKLLLINELDGLLVGHSSLNIKEFIKIIEQR